MDENLDTWIKELVDLAVRGTAQMNVYGEALIEARPEWVLPNRLLVGKVREQMNPRTFHWFICGEVPLDYVPGNVASAPRDALRYFAMKWQLDAERTPEKNEVAILVENAEAVYALAEDERFWQT